MRYQKGSIRLEKRKSQPDVWTFRYREEGPDGQRIYRKQVLGDVTKIPKRKDAEKLVLEVRVNVNEMAASYTPTTMEMAVAHYKENEMDRLAYATREAYKVYLRLYILPKYGSVPLGSVRPNEVEKWLRGLTRANGKPMAPGTRAKLRNMLSAIYSHSIREGWVKENPITEVRSSSKRVRMPVYLEHEELLALLEGLTLRDRVAVLLAASTGLRRSELFALRWMDVDPLNGIAQVSRSIYRNVIGDCKTEASRKPVPMHDLVLATLDEWRAITKYKGPEDFILASEKMKGTQPLQPDMVLKRRIRPTLKRLGITKTIGWHSFRHGFSNMLRREGVDVKVAQELLRHANPRITQEFYQEAVSAERRSAQNQVMSAMLQKKTGA